MSGATIKLAAPIKAHADFITELVLREPTVEDTLDLGMPYAIDVSGDGAALVFKPAVVARYVTRLAQVPMSTVKALPMDKWMECQMVVQGFFGRSDDESPASSQSAPSSSPGSGE